MTTKDALQIATPTEVDVVMTRVFDAPADLVFDAWTKPELVRRWLGVWGGRTMTECEIDLRVGGGYRFVWRQSDGSETGVRGDYLDVAAPARLAYTEVFDYAWYPGGATISMTFEQREGSTIVTTATRYESREARDMVLQSQRGVAKNYELLDELLLTSKR
jgi:uncharacterized protein YndB with AHSA1/START domain